MKAILIARALSLSESKSVKERLERKEAAVYFCEPYNQFATFGALPCAEITEEEKKEINFRLFNVLLSFGDFKVGQKSVKELLDFEQTSLWYYYKFRIYFLARNLSFDIKRYKNWADPFENVEIYESNSFYLKLTHEFPNVKFHIQPQKKKKHLVSVLNLYVTIMWRTIQGFFQLSKAKKYKHAVIDNRDHYRSLLSPVTLTNEYENNFFGYLYAPYADQFLFMDEFIFPKLDARFKIQKKYIKNWNARNRINNEIHLVKALFRPSNWKKIRALNSSLKQNYNCIAQAIKPSSDQLIILDKLRSFHRSSLYFGFRILAFRAFFKKHNFRTVTTVDEYSPAYKSLLDAAKNEGIKTIGVQHGSMHALHPGYVYTKNDSKYQPMPDKTILWGEKWGDFLSKEGNFPADKLLVAGQIRTDIIPILKQHKSSKEKVLGPLFHGKSVVTYASQPQRDPKLRYRAAKDMLSAVAQLPDVSLAIKLHPRENEPDYFHEIAREVGCKNYQLYYEIDLFLLLSLSDIVVTCFSTVGTETIYFKKPLIILDHLKQDILNYNKEGVAFQVSQASQLQETIEKIINGQLGINEIAYNQYIKNYAYQIDGQASKRYWDIIQQIGSEK